MTHLWEIDHPYYGADGYSTHFDSFAEMREAVDDADEDMNHVYRWDWIDYSQPQHDDLFMEGEDRSEQKLKLFLVLPRKSMFLEWSCPISHEQEAEVLEWLRGPRILGSLRKMWEPLLDGQGLDSVNAHQWSVRYPDGFVDGGGFTEAGARQRATELGGEVVYRAVGPWTAAA